MRSNFVSLADNRYCTIFKPFQTPIWNGKQNSLTGPIITGSFEKRAPDINIQTLIGLSTHFLEWFLPNTINPLGSSSVLSKPGLPVLVWPLATVDRCSVRTTERVALVFANVKQLREHKIVL